MDQPTYVPMPLASKVSLTLSQRPSMATLPGDPPVLGVLPVSIPLDNTPFGNTHHLFSVSSILLVLETKDPEALVAIESQGLLSPELCSP